MSPSSSHPAPATPPSTTHSPRTAPQAVFQVGLLQSSPKVLMKLMIDAQAGQWDAQREAWVDSRGENVQGRDGVDFTTEHIKSHLQVSKCCGCIPSTLCHYVT